MTNPQEASYWTVLQHAISSTIIHAKACGFEVSGKDASMSLMHGKVELVIGLGVKRGIFTTHLTMTNPSISDIMVVTTTIERFSSVKALQPDGDMEDLHNRVFEDALEALG